jgi:hypothetical protein
MNLFNKIKKVFVKKQKINLKTLPSQGIFYEKDFQLKIKMVDKNEILDYEKNYLKDNLSIILYKIKKVVESNTILSKGYKFDDIKSIDIIFLFLEIVKFTKGKPVILNYIDNNLKENQIEFGPKSFNYFKLTPELEKKWNQNERVFEIDGYKYSLPSIGIENTVTNFLLRKSIEPDAIKYNSYDYSFTFFVGHKNQLSYEEIENLIEIFNFDMDPEEQKRVKEIAESMRPIQVYSLKKDDLVIEMNAKIDLQYIFK